MPETIDLEETEAFLLDMDGVVHIGESVIEGSKRAVQRLREKNKKLMFLTNNSTKTRSYYREKYSQLGLDIEESEIMTSSYATALYLSENATEKTAYVIGEEGLKKDLEKLGFEILPFEESEKASFVVAGMDRKLNYEKIWGGLKAILAGADFIATNPDPTYPTEEGLAPGAGASIGALSGSAEKEPSEVIGKPSTYMLETSLEMLEVSPENAVMIGDRVSTDIYAGNKLGLTTILVLTGVNSEKDAETVSGTKKAPDHIIPCLAELNG